MGRLWEILKKDDEEGKCYDYSGKVVSKKVCLARAG
jgi:hypothetical protein